MFITADCEVAEAEIRHAVRLLPKLFHSVFELLDRQLATKAKPSPTEETVLFTENGTRKMNSG